MNLYTAGQIIELTATFLNDAGVATDPSTVVVKYAIVPSGSTTAGPETILTYTGATSPAVGIVAKTATGAYEAQVDTTGMPSGLLTYQWYSTGTAQTTSPAGEARIAAATYP